MLEEYQHKSNMLSCCLLLKVKLGLFLFWGSPKENNQKVDVLTHNASEWLLALSLQLLEMQLKNGAFCFLVINFLLLSKRNTQHQQSDEAPCHRNHPM
jgi:hypothetical protein